MSSLLDYHAQHPRTILPRPLLIKTHPLPTATILLYTGSDPTLTHILGLLPDYCCTSCGSEVHHCLASLA